MGSGNTDILQLLAAQTTQRGGEAMAPPNFEFEVVRAFQEKQQLFLQVRQRASDMVDWVTMSLLNTDQGGRANIVHQITNRNVPRINPDRTRVAGTGSIDLTADASRTRAIVMGFAKAVFLSGDADACRDWLDVETFRSYNPYMEPSFSGFVDFLRQEMSRPDPLRYVCISDIVAQGDYAAIFSIIDFRGGEYRACDLFRVEEGKIVEHWDIAECSDHQRPAGNDRSFMPL